MAELPQRHSIRMRGYDYANEGAYFLTICTHDRRHVFGWVVDGVMVPNALGDIAQRCWDAIPEHMPHVDVGPFVVMPNHVHGIVVIRERLVDVRGRALDGAVVGPARADHGRPVDRDGSVDHGMSRTMNDTEHAMPTNDGVDGDAMSTAPHAQCRADHGRPLRPPTSNASPPTVRRMPTVPHGSLGGIVAAYKSSVTRIAYRDGVLPHGTPVWQRNYWDDIIRGDGAYERIAQYIRDNPANWKGDRFNR